MHDWHRFYSSKMRSLKADITLQASLWFPEAPFKSGRVFIVFKLPYNRQNGLDRF